MKIKHNLAFWPLYASFVLIYIGVSIRQNSGLRVPMGLRYWKSFAFLLSPRLVVGAASIARVFGSLGFAAFCLTRGRTLRENILHVAAANRHGKM